MWPTKKTRVTFRRFARKSTTLKPFSRNIRPSSRCAFGVVLYLYGVEQYKNTKILQNLGVLVTQWHVRKTTFIEMYAWCIILFLLECFRSSTTANTCFVFGWKFKMPSSHMQPRWLMLVFQVLSLLHVPINHLQSTCDIQAWVFY